jgi:hypothetical protein
VVCSLLTAREYLSTVRVIAWKPVSNRSSPVTVTKYRVAAPGFAVAASVRWSTSNGPRRAL